MISFAALLVVGVIAGQVCGDAPEAIVGGKTAWLGQFPHQISIRWEGHHICGGSIISPTHVITAAHCVWEPELYPSMTIVSGTLRSQGDGTISKIKCVRLHEDFDGKRVDGFKDDIAVITLEAPLEFSQEQNMIPLPTTDCTIGEFRGLISGWGQTEVGSDTSPLLQWLDVEVFSKDKCLDAHPKNTYGEAFTTEKQVCTLVGPGHGACTGDSGGPLVTNGELCGIASWVIRCALGKADVFTKVGAYLDWIKESQTMC